MTILIVLLENVPAGTGGGLWRAGDTQPAADDYAKKLIGAGRAYAADGSLLDVVSGAGNIAGLTADVTWPATVAANVDAIQTALSAGGTRSLAIAYPGAVYLSNQVVIASNTRLVGSPGSTLKSVGGTNKPIIVNAAYLAATVAATPTWTSGPTLALAFSAGHGLTLEVGGYLSVAGLSPSHFLGAFPIISVADANTCTVHLYRVPTTSPTGTCAVKQCDQNITIDGLEYDYNYSGGNDSGTQTPNRHGVILGFIAQSKVINLRPKDVNKFGLCIGSAANVTVSGVHADPETHSDGVKVYGPAFGVHVEDVSGAFGDDIMSFHTQETAAFAGYDFNGGGDILSSTARRIRGRSGTVKGPGVYGRANHFIDDVHFHDVACQTVNSMCFAWGAASDLAQVGRLTFNNISGHAGTYGVDMNYVNWSDVEVNGFTATYGTHGIGGTTGGTQTGRRFTIRGQRHTNATAGKLSFFPNAWVLDQWNLAGFINESATSGNYPIQLTATSIDEINIEKTLDTSAQRGLELFSGAYGKINIKECRKEGTGDIFLAVGSAVTGVPVISLTDNSTLSATVVSVNAACKISSRGNKYASNSNGVVRITGSMAVRIDGDGSDEIGSSAHVVVVSGSPTIDNRSEKLTQAPAYAASYTPDLGLGPIVNVGALTGNITVNNPSNVPAKGTKVRVYLTQDGTGGRTVTWGTNYIFPTAWSDTGNTASKQSFACFESDGTKLVAQGANAWY